MANMQTSSTNSFNLNGWNKWGIPQYSHVMKCKGKPKLYGPTGGELKKNYKTALHWYSEKARTTPDRRHSRRLIAQFTPSEAGSITSSSSSKHFAPIRPKTSVPSSPNSSNWSYWNKKQPQTVNKPTNLKRTKSSGSNLNNLKVEGRTLTFAEEGTPRSPRASSLPPKKERPQTVKVTGDISIDVGLDYKGPLRPKSAMAAIENQYMNPYSTSYDINYGTHPTGDKSSSADRPKTSRGYTSSYKLSAPIGTTHFDDEYGPKKLTEKTEAIRSGTSSGTRNNNPHPDKAFMVWRYPKDRKHVNVETCGAPAANRNYKKLTDETFDEIVRDNFRSTYDQDYMGIPQGYQMKDAIDAPDDWRDQVPRPDDTSTRRTYKTPHQHPTHKLSTSRYDCNKLYVKPAVGIVPTVSKRHVLNQKNIKEKTVYVDEYFDRSVNPKLNRLLNQRCDRNWEQFYLQATSLSTENRAKEVEVAEG